MLKRLFGGLSKDIGIDLGTSNSIFYVKDRGMVINEPTVCAINTRTGAKIAGAAQKRNKHGLLFQGSIEKAAVGPVDWDDFQARFVTALGRALGAAAMETPWPDLNEDEVSGLVEQYSAPEWIEHR